MTKAGGKLAEVSSGHLRQRLAEETDSKAIKRLVAALEYKSGLSPAKIEDKYGWPEQTIYSWFNRFEERGVEATLRDAPRPGRRSELNTARRQQLFAAVNEPPTEAGCSTKPGCRSRQPGRTTTRPILLNNAVGNRISKKWPQLKAARANRLFLTLADLKVFLKNTLPTLTSPNIYEYLC